MKNLFFFLLLLGSMALSSCNSYGSEKDFNGVQLFYTSSVTEAEADKFGKFLIDSEFADGDKKTVQINRKDDIFQFRMVVKKGLEKDEDYSEIAKTFAAAISEQIVEGGKVEIHFCDEYLKTLKVITN
jgi:hypothetical protein